MVEKGELLGALGARLRSLRTAAGLSIEELASRAETHSSNIGAIERGERNPTVFMLARLASGLEVDLETVVDLRAGATPKQLRSQLSGRLRKADPATLRAILTMLDALT